MRVDAHQHFWHYNPQRDTRVTKEMAVLKRDFLAGDLRGESIANRFYSSIVVPADQSEAKTAFLLDIAAQAAWVAAVVGWVDLTSPRLAERLKFFTQFSKLRGFRHVVQAEPDERFLVRANFLRGLREPELFRFTYQLLVYRDQWKTRIRELAQSPNVCCKLSGLVTEADWHCWKYEDLVPFLAVVFEALSRHRLMFGSDWPVCLLAASYAQVVQIIEAYIDRHAPHGKIFGANALCFYGVETPAWTCN